MKILLVTGSRTLREGRAPGWAWKLLEPAVAAADCVVAGDASGPDSWAMDLASAMCGSPRERMQFALDGWIYRAEAGLATSRSEQWHPNGRAGPLYRNEVMVRHVAKMGAQGAVVHVVALVAPWSRTRGTEHTGRLAERAGFAVEWHACPRELGPQEARRG